MAEHLSVGVLGRNSRSSPAGSTTSSGTSSRSRGGQGAAAPRRKVRLPELVVGVLLVAGSALAAVVWQQSVTSGRGVVVAARDVPRGAVVTADDLAIVEVSGGQEVELVASSDAASLVGTVAVVDVGVGTPWSPALVSAVAPLTTGDGLVAVALAPGEVPPGLVAGDSVRVVVVRADTGEAQSRADLRPRVAVVWDVIAPGELGNDTVVTLRLSLDEAALVAAAEDVRLLGVGS